MSLLMDALRKAEQAKRQTESASNRGGEPRPEIESRPAQSDAPPSEPGAPLPELPSKLELLDDQFGNVTGAADGVKARPPAAPPPKPAAEHLARERKAAQQVFAAKEPQQPSRRGFYFGLAGATLAAAVAIGGYFWWQLQPRSTLIAMAPGTGSAPPPGGRLTTPAAPGPAPLATPSGGAPAVSPPPAAPLTATGAIAASPGVAAAADKSAREEPATPRRTRPARPAIERGQLADAPAADGAAPDTSIRISRSRAQIDPALERGYRHFQAGDLAAARSSYEQVLRRDPRNADALNGLAAIALHGGDGQTAEAYYQRTLETDPRDATAQAGLIGLRGSADPVQAESRLKSLAAGQPDAHGTHFALGNLYAAQGRWHEAQQAYFRAYSADPDNPDYQFNLAVSLDQLRQPRLALQYYQGALAGAASRPAAFDQAQAATRVRELQQP